jgi:Protein of unknown function (DUF2934)
MASTAEKKSPAKKPLVKKAIASKPKSAAVSKPKPVKTAAVKKAPVKKASKTSSVKISAAERYRMIETAAYFIAERNNFTGNSADYWIAAEAQIKKMLAK